MKMLTTFAFLLLISLTSTPFQRHFSVIKEASFIESFKIPLQVLVTVEWNYRICESMLPKRIRRNVQHLRGEDAKKRDCHPQKKFDVGFKRSGVVLHSHATPTINHCVHKCKIHPNCTAINYNTTDKACNMISSSPKVTKVSEITSSLVKTECNDICYSKNLIYGYIRKGHDIYCIAWDYLHTHKICHLKNGIPDLEEGSHHGEVYTGFGCTAGEFPRANDAVVT